MTIITLLHVLAGAAIVIYTGDMLRQIVGHRHLVTVLACALVCIGAFGGICQSLRHGATFYDFALSAGVAIYCALRHRGRPAETGALHPTVPAPFDSDKR